MFPRGQKTAYTPKIPCRKSNYFPGSSHRKLRGSGSGFFVRLDDPCHTRGPLRDQLDYTRRARVGPAKGPIDYCMGRVAVPTRDLRQRYQCVRMHFESNHKEYLQPQAYHFYNRSFQVRWSRTSRTSNRCLFGRSKNAKSHIGLLVCIFEFLNGPKWALFETRVFTRGQKVVTHPQDPVPEK